MLTDPADCGPVTLALCQDVQAEAYRLSRELLRGARLDAAPRPSDRRTNSTAAIAALQPGEEAADHRRRRRALFAGASATLTHFAEAARHSGRARRRPASHRCRPTIRSTWARSASPARRPPTRLAEQADVVLAVGTRLQDFTTGSWALFKNDRQDDHRRSTCSSSMPSKHRALAAGLADAEAGLKMIAADVGGYQAPDDWVRAGQRQPGKMARRRRARDRRRPTPSCRPTRR